jgi:hypothetical protein
VQIGQFGRLGAHRVEAMSRSLLNRER